MTGNKVTQWLKNNLILPKRYLSLFPILLLLIATIKISQTPNTVLADTTQQLTVQSVTASSNDGNIPENTLDNNLNTRWSALGDPQWIQYQLNTTFTLQYIDLAFYKGNERKENFDLSTSTDGNTWTLVYSAQSGGKTNGSERFDFPDTDAVYIRITGHGNTANLWNSITKTTIYGVNTSPSPSITLSPTATPTNTPSPIPTTEPTPTNIPFPSATPSPLRTVSVSNASQLQTALTNSLPGDLILAADGNYSKSSAYTISNKSASLNNPIVLKSINNQGAIISSCSGITVTTSSYITIEGFKFTNTCRSALKLTGSNNVRITRNQFRLVESNGENRHWIQITGSNSHHNRIDHNLFEEKHQLGNFIGTDGSNGKSTKNDTIDHNYFRNIGPRADNGMEAIRLGLSSYTSSNAYFTVEYNLFENCDGDPEVISVKTSDNLIRYNTFRNNYGAVVLRHGNRSTVQGNFFLGDGIKEVAGVRAHADDHKIINNYFENITGIAFDIAAAIMLPDGDADLGDSTLTKHFRTRRTVVAYNTLVNNLQNIQIGMQLTSSHILAPKDLIISNNVVEATSGAIINILDQPSNTTYSKNIMYPTFNSTLGISATTNQVQQIDPDLTQINNIFKLTNTSPAINSADSSITINEDLDGQLRNDNQNDIGADEYSSDPIIHKPLTSSDVGPNSI